MIKNANKKLEAETLRERAEALHKRNTLNENSNVDEAGVLKLIHELQVHKIELELQNEEIIHAKEKAEEEAERFRSIVENTNAGYFFIDNNGLFQNVNQAWLNIYKYESLDEVKGKHFTMFQQDEDIEKAIEFLEGIRKGNLHNMTGEFSLKCKDGSIGYHTFSARVVYSENEIIGIEGFLIDITNQRIAELEIINTKEKAEEHERKLNAAIESMSDAVFISDTEGNFIDFNDAFATFHRFKNKEECAKTLKEYQKLFDVYLPNGELASLEQWAVPSALRGETGTNKEFTLKRKDTNETWVGSYNYAPIKNNKGDIVGSVVTAHDITKRKQSEFIIKEKEKKYRDLFNSIRDSILITNTERNIIDCNPAFNELFGYSLNEIIGKKTSYLYENENQYLDMGKAIKNNADKDVSFFYTINYKKKNKEIFPGETGVHFLKNENGENNGYIGLIRDVNKRKQAENDLKNAMDLLKQLYIHQNDLKEDERKSISREIHDELGQSLSALKIDLGWLKSHSKRDDIKCKINGMTEIVNETIKTIQRISSDLRPNLLDDLGLTQAIEGYCQEFEERTEIKIQINIDDINISNERLNLSLYRIIQESLTNVARHANARNVDVLLSELEDSILLQIKDDGIGISQEKINSPKSFGLIGMKERVLQFNGNLKFDTNTETGTKITVQIPLQKNVK